jgi:hypothetical protein
MNCHFCGKVIGLAALASQDSDFCCSDHRSRFHVRLRKAVSLVQGPPAHVPDLASPAIAFVAGDLPFQPSVRLALARPLRMPAEWPATIEPVFDADTAQEDRPVLLDPTQSEDRPQQEAPAELTNPKGTHRPGKLDRIAFLGSRLQTLRTQLDRVSSMQKQLATA